MDEVVSAEARSEKKIWSVIVASSVGTLIEWYDFYIFGSLSVVLAAQFFPKGNSAMALLSTLATFAIGFVVRPFGALFFGRIGDLVGRKYTFLVTLLVMGGSTFAIGLMPGFATIGWAAPVILVLIRLLQGLALGGEYGGAATYVAEHSPDGKRGYYTSFIQTTATLGLFVSLGVIMACEAIMDKQAFSDWGWRIPFLLSSVLIVFSLVLRLRMAESPLFAQAKKEGKTSTNPLRDSFANWGNAKVVLIALFGATMGQGVVWYTGQFNALFFLQTVLNVDKLQANWIVSGALLIGAPFFVVFGWLSDRIGRKKIILAGCLLAALLYFPIYHGMAAAANFDPNLPKAPAHDINVAVLVALVTVQVIFVTMVYGPIAAFLVELFPTKIRYTSMSLPYHIGNGVFGGMVPFFFKLIQSNTGDIYAGLWYSVIIAGLTCIVGGLLIKENMNVKMWGEGAAAS